MPEPNKCADVRYGRTVWAWFHTDRWVRTDLHVTASFPALFALMPFRSPAHPALDPAAGVCISTPGTDIAFGQPLPAAGPGWYAIQVGGQNDAGGQVAATLHLLPPSQIAASARITAKKKSSGVAVDLRVKAPEGARIALRCVRVKCGRLDGRLRGEERGGQVLPAADPDSGRRAARAARHEPRLHRALHGLGRQEWTNWQGDRALHGTGLDPAAQRMRRLSPRVLVPAC